MTNPTRFDVAVCGAGAAGLMAAIFAARSGARVGLLDGAARIGAKILISGGGRCNVTHDVVHAADFNGGSRNVIARVLRTFPVDDTVRFFEDLGVRLKREETGKLFPVTDKARTVLDALLGVAPEVLTNHRVIACHPERERGAWVEGRHRDLQCHPSPRPLADARGDTFFRIETSSGIIEASRVILATGGRSVPKTGSDGHGYALARSLGHTVSAVWPALVPLVTGPSVGAGFSPPSPLGGLKPAPTEGTLTALSGISVEAELSVGKHRERGSLLFAHFGLSGPVVLDISRHWIANRPAPLLANFLPGETFASLENALLATKHGTAASFLGRRLPDRLAEALGDKTPLTRLTKDDRRRIVRNVVEHVLPVTKDRGFDYAEVTAGGVPLSEVDPSTMASRRCPGLFLCGEILDVDGKIGGYNFQWAWASGRLAGLHAANVGPPLRRPRTA